MAKRAKSNSKAQTSKAVLVSSQKDAAAAFGIAPSSFREWMRDPTFPDCTAGYDLTAITEWRAQHQQRRRSIIEIREDRERADAELAQIKAEKELIVLELLTGEVVYRESVDVLLANIAAKVRDWHKLAVTLIAQKSAAPKKYHQGIGQAVDDEVRSLLTTIVTESRRVLAELDRAKEHEARKRRAV